MQMLDALSASERSSGRRRPIAIHSRRPQRPFLSLASTVASVLSLSSICRPVTAASVRFENCLPESRIQSEPKLLQWVPKFVDASFNTADPKYTLRVTMWGNVTGSSTGNPLPPLDSPDWANPNKTEGKIVDVPDRDSDDPRITTLRSKIDVLTYEPWGEPTDLCGTSLAKNSTCPLGPVFIPENSELLPYILPSVSMSHDFYSSYAFTSFSPTFKILNGDPDATVIGCVSAVVTPDLGSLVWMLKFLPLMVLVLVGAATVFAAIFSPWGTSDIFHWSSNYGRDPDLLRLVTPGFGDCLQYIQFIVLTGGLTLNYPGYYQPMVSQASWSALMFNHSFVTNSPGWQAVRDGIYFTDDDYGLGRLAQLSGMAEEQDVWPGMMVWLLVIIAAVFVLVQAGFLVQWLYRFIRKISEEDLRAKNIPFTIGNVIRIVLNYFLFPIVALSTFQLVVAGNSPIYSVVLASVTLVLIIGFGAWMLHLIATTKPRAFLFDDLPTVLLYGPLYNTYSDEAVAFTLIPFVLAFVRGIAVGAVQPAGVAQVVLLAVCEVIQILTLHAFRPFHSPTSMNAYHTLFAALRLVTVLLMVAFVPSLGVTEGAKGWIGYAILVTHAGVLVLGFLLNAVQTIVEVLARMLGAGGDDILGQSRGGLSKIFGMRQLSRRASRRENGPSRQSQLSSSAMLDIDDTSKTGYIMPSGRVRSESAGSMGVMMHHRQTSLSGMDTPSLDGPARRHDSISGSFTPTTPGEASTFSFLPSPGHPVRPPGALAVQAPDPYYRPPRQRRPTMETSSSPATKMGGAWTGGDWAQKRLSQGTGTVGDPSEIGPQISRDVTPAPYAIPFTPRTDYSMREADFYYGVRGQRLNSYAPSRKLGTGPADPTGPMASAAGWLRNMFKAKGKDKGKGFEVVRSARMPPAMRATGGDFADDPAPEGIPVAMGVLRNGPIESDDESGNKVATQTPQQEPTIDDLGIPKTTGGAIEKKRDSAASSQWDGDAPPDVPRKSSKRDSNSHAKAAPLLQPPELGGSANLTPSNTASSRLPFERTPSERRLSGSSAGLTEELSQVDLQDPSGSSGEVTATGYGFVNQGSVHRVDREVDLLGLGTSAEVVNERR
ncbi:putative flavin carrier protein 3 [Cladorrhinum sp. PSN332]|nr:putative flavin carrier protein 3 [Cladorrhinum sp. PSN332]